MSKAVLLVVYLAAGVRAHEAHRELPASGPSAARQRVLKRIGADYKAAVKPIFQVKCWDCHSQHTRYPFYYRLPGARWLIDRDIRQARKHLDMTGDFPFQSHGDPEDDLDGIRDIVQTGAMPPLRYRLLHWGSGLRAAERDIILRWVEESRKLLPGENP